MTVKETGSPNRREEGSSAGCLALQSGEEVTVRDQRLTEDEAALLNAHLKVGLHAIEKNVKRDMTRVLEPIPIFQEWFSKIRGVGPLLAGAIIGEISTINRFEHISNLWSWVGFGTHTLIYGAVHCDPW